MGNRVWMVGVAAVLGAVVTVGQPAPARAGVGSAGVKAGQHPGMARLKKLADSLGLTPGQKAQIKPLLKDRVQQVRAVRGNTALTPAQKKAQIKDIRQASGQQIMAILTPDQKTKLAQLRHQRRNG